jgi:hypothetical protein
MRTNLHALPDRRGCRDRARPSRPTGALRSARNRVHSHSHEFTRWKAQALTTARALKAVDWPS